VSERALAAADPGRVWTVLDLLRWTTQHFSERGIDTPRLDAECLLAHALGCDRLRLYLEFDKPVVEASARCSAALVRARANERVPGRAAHRRARVLVAAAARLPDVLIPRPTPRRWSSAALDLLPDAAAPARVLDLGTGTGAVALALAHERPRAAIVASDRSPKALRIAQQNAEALGMAARIHFLRGDWTRTDRRARSTAWSRIRPISRMRSGRRSPRSSRTSPRRAVRGSERARSARAAVPRGPPAARERGGLAFELAPGQEKQVQAWLAEAGLATAVHRDLAGRERVVTGRTRAR
jgi:release factor glutamine methyltransferase